MDKEFIHLDQEKCISCFACVRTCPVKAFEMHNGSDIPVLQHNKCIVCGNCVGVCQPGAITYTDSKAEVMALLDSGRTVAALVDPAISAEFDDVTDYRKFVAMLQHLGFEYVHEVAFGVDLVAREYNSLINDFMGKYYLLTNCPPIVYLIEKFHPELIDNLAPIVNPMVASAKSVRQVHGADTAVVFIGPCVAAKAERHRHHDDGQVDAVLTFAELRLLFEQADLKESTIEFSDFTEPTGYKGSLYPKSTGILQAAGINQDLLAGTVITADGMRRTLEAVKQFRSSVDTIHKHFSLFHCEGCLMGPGMKPNGLKYHRQSLVYDYVNKRLKSFNMARWNKDIREFGSVSLRAEFVNDDQRPKPPPESRIAEVLRIIGKEEAENFNCQSCGYDNCREFATDVALGCTRPDMCVLHSLKTKQDTIHALKTNNDKLQRSNQQLQVAESKAKQEAEAVRVANETFHTLLQKLPTAVVLVDENLKVISANDSFVQTLGAEAIEISEVIPGLIGADLKTLLPVQYYKLFSYVLGSNEDVTGKDIRLNDKLLILNIFSIKANKIAGGVVRDMHMPEVRKEEVISRVTDVIDQNLDLVQQIAFLLGEGAAKTEKMLNSIIESYRSREAQ